MNQSIAVISLETQAFLEGLDRTTSAEMTELANEMLYAAKGLGEYLEQNGNGKSMLVHLTEERCGIDMIANEHDAIKLGMMQKETGSGFYVLRMKIESNEDHVHEDTIALLKQIDTYIAQTESLSIGKMYEAVRNQYLGNAPEQGDTDKSISEKENTTMAWTNPPQAKPQEQAQTQEQGQENLAYIHKDTREAAKENPHVDSIAQATLEAAKRIMDKVAEAGLTTESQTRDGSKTYTDKLVVKVDAEQATAFDKATGEEKALSYKDGSPVHRATAEIQHKGTKLILYASKQEDGSVEFSKMGASRWNTKEGKADYYKQGEIQSAYINRDIKAIAAMIEEQGLLAERQGGDREQSALRSFAYEANQYFNANTEKVPNENGELVNNAYAKYQNDEYGEKVTLYNHDDSIAVELGTTSEGKPYALALNYDYNANGEPRQEGEAPAKAYLNKITDLDEYDIKLPEIREMVSQFKFEGAEHDQSKDKDNKSAEQSKKKNEVERD